MTVAAASDFQLRPAMFSGRPSLLSFIKYRFGNHTCNLEHRRVNHSKSRWSRVERKALVFFPTLNERLSVFKELFPQRPLPIRALIARESSRAPRSLPRLSVCDFCRGMSIYMRAIFWNQSQSASFSSQTGRTTARFSSNGSAGCFDRAQNFSVRQFLRQQSSRCRA